MNLVRDRDRDRDVLESEFSMGPPHPASPTQLNLLLHASTFQQCTISIAVTDNSAAMNMGQSVVSSHETFLSFLVAIGDFLNG